MASTTIKKIKMHQEPVPSCSFKASFSSPDARHQEHRAMENESQLLIINRRPLKRSEPAPGDPGDAWCKRNDLLLLVLFWCLEGIGLYIYIYIYIYICNIYFCILYRNIYAHICAVICGFGSWRCMQYWCYIMILKSNLKRVWSINKPLSSTEGLGHRSSHPSIWCCHFLCLQDALPQKPEEEHGLPFKVLCGHI